MRWTHFPNNLLIVAGALAWYSMLITTEVFAAPVPTRPHTLRSAYDAAHPSPPLLRRISLNRGGGDEEEGTVLAQRSSPRLPSSDNSPRLIHTARKHHQDKDQSSNHVMDHASGHHGHYLSQKQLDEVDVGFNLSLVTQRATELASHSWEQGGAAQLLLEVYSPQHSIYGPRCFQSNGSITPLHADQPALTYAKEQIQTGHSTLANGDGASGDPASLGVAATLLGLVSGDQKYASSAQRQLSTLVESTPRYSNGAISTRTNELSYWADWTYMAPPFMAFQATATTNTTLLKSAVRQLQLYSDALSYRDTNGRFPVAKGLWRHIQDSSSESKGLWTTGQAWALNGILRTLSTVVRWPTSTSWTTEQSTLLELAEGIISPLIACTQGSGSCGGLDSSSGLLRGYLIGGPGGVSDDSAVWPGEVAGTAGVTSALYRYATMVEQQANSSSSSSLWRSRPLKSATVLGVADKLRKAVAQHVNSSGYAQPAMNGYDWVTPGSVEQSPEAQVFAGIMGAAYRDCVGAKVCTT